MKSYRFDWHARSLGAAWLTAFLLTASFIHGQVAVPAKKAADEDPPLPSKKPVPAKQTRVQVTASSAEVQSGDKVVATVKRGQVLTFTKKTDEYYLVVVDGKKGWIKKEAVREIEVVVRDQESATVEVPAGPAPAAIDKETARKVKRATAFLRVRLAAGKTVEGSGFFAFQPGLVLTNAHVLGMLGAASRLPLEVRVVVHSGEPEEFTLPAQVLAVDRENDLGVLRVQGRAGRLPAPLPVDTSRALALLQKVYIFGFPFGTSLGKDITVSESSISSIRKDATGAAKEIQVNGGMNPGNSGGPVVDSRGVVVGVAVSKIRGTQISFAVPGEKVQELLRGRVCQTQFGEVFRDKDQAKLPIRLSCLDPLQRIRTVKLEVWAGRDSPARLPAPTEPKPLPGDGSRRSVDVPYPDGSAQIDLAIPSLDAGQVLWIQPVLTDTSGAKHWAKAVAYRPSDLPPLERKAAVLQQEFERHLQRTLKLTSFVQAQLSKGSKQTLYRDFMEIEMLETAQKEARGGRFDLFPGDYKFTTTEMNEKTRPLLPQAQPFLRNRNLTFILDFQGAMLQRTIPVLNPPFPAALREDFAELVHQIANSYEMACLAVPNRRVEAQESWKARLPLILTYPGKKQIIFDMLLTCTYEGSRVHKGQKEAVISLSGSIKGREAGQQSTAGTATGKVHFALGDGYLSRANIKVETQDENDQISLAHSLEVSLTRVPGNKANIAVRPVAPVPGVPLVAGTDYDLAIPHLQKRDFDQAIPLLEKAVAANPNLITAHNDLGFAYNEKRLYDKAIPHLKKVIELQPNHVTAHNNLGAAYNGKGLYDQAIPCFKKAIELNPNHRAAHSNLGFAYNRKKLYDQAIPYLEKAIELDPQNPAPYSHLGFAYNEKHLYDKAIQCFKKIIDLDPNQSTAHNNLGLAYNGKGFYDDAIPCFQKALQLQPKNASAQNNLGFAYKGKGLYDKAIPYFQKALELRPKSAVAYDNLSAILSEIGDLEQARDVLKKALALTSEAAPQFKSSKKNLEEAETLLRLATGLADFVKAEPKPKNFQEGLRFAKLCRVKQYYRAALRFAEQSMNDNPDAAKKQAPVNWMILARVALLASTGQGNDPPPEADRSKYRAKAFAWLRKYVKAQQEALEKNLNANRYACQRHLRALSQHKDLASIRPPALDKLPAEERQGWEELWNEVDALLDKADALVPDPAPGEKP